MNDKPKNRKSAAEAEADTKPQQSAEAPPAEAPPAEATPAEAPPAEATPAEATPAEAPPAVGASRRPRVTTVVWGLVVAAVGLGLLAIALGFTFDAELAVITVIGAAGALLLVGSIATARRRS